MGNNYPLLFLILFVLNSCKFSNESIDNDHLPDLNLMYAADTLNIPDTLLHLYYEDAAILALRDIHHDENKKKTVIKIPDHLIQMYYHGLLHNYNQLSCPARDSVINMYKIHCLSEPQTHSILISVDGEEEWVQSWKNHSRLTGNESVDNLVVNYSLELKRYYDWPTNDAVLLESQQPLNIYALAQLFSAIPGVLSAEPNQIIGHGNNIEGNFTDNSIEFEYAAGFGDWCTSKHYWLFEVDYEGNVKFIKSYGEKLP